ncbi:hypothetical protein PAMC26577_06315 [Caballeronia sordidicola]|uniref:Uncharacterized protein n=1 Tax=Caballeronia sordidicola TaxID=196367 RepID=A0A242N3J4_CABSO|nr:hypothetical protein PAMC26577_06315 [Caballeronia sordidicola]
MKRIAFAPLLTYGRVQKGFAPLSAADFERERERLAGMWTHFVTGARSGRAPTPCR